MATPTNRGIKPLLLADESCLPVWSCSSIARMNSELQTPRCPYDKIGGLVFLGRTIDKIRLKAAGKLRPDFFELMGDGYDARIMGYLNLDYSKFAAFVLSGASDEECWQYCVQH